MWSSMRSCIPTSQTDPTLKFAKPSWLLLLAGVAVLFLFSSCDTGPAGLGSEVLPQGDLVSLSFTDTIPLDLQSIRIDSVNTYQASLQLFGNYIDPQFGTISAKTFTQVFPRSGLQFGKPADLKFDSIVLSIDIDAFYGRPEQVQTIRVHKLTQAFPDTNEIYSSRELAYDPRDLANGRLLGYDNLPSTKIIRIRLDDALGESILFGDSVALADRDRFLQEILPGLMITTDPVAFLNREPGAIFSIAGASTQTQLELYYQKFDTTTSTFLKRVEPFPIAASTPRYHSLRRTDLSGKLLEQGLPFPDTSNLYEFLQSGLLIKTWVRLPSLLQAETRLVSKAELILPVDPSTLGSSDRFLPPFEILALRADASGSELLENNLGLSVSSTALALTYNSSRKAYVVPISGYVQRLFNGSIDDENGFLIVPADARASIRRAVLAGTDHPDPAMRPRLEITSGSVPR